MTKTLNLSEPYKFTAGQAGLQTRNGRKAEVYCIRDKGDLPIHGAICDKETGVWFNIEWHLDGQLRHGLKRAYDLMPPKRKEVWVAVWEKEHTKQPYTLAFDTSEEAEEYMECESRTRIAVLGPVDREPVELKEEKGDD